MKKEKELIRLRQLGLSYKAIAEELGTTEGTVKVDFCRLYRKLGIHSTAEFFAHPEIKKLAESAPSAPSKSLEIKN